jgi:hypothetical protein
MSRAMSSREGIGCLNTEARSFYFVSFVLFVVSL